MPRAAIYTRISVDRDGHQTATSRQLEDCRTFIKARGWEEAGVYEDPDISAFKRKPRPSFERLKEDLLAGRVDVVVGWKLDRLFRRITDLGYLVEAMGARVVTVVDGIDTGTSAGRLVATMMTGVANNETETMSLRLRRKHQELARDGKPHGGPRPFGFAEWGATVSHHPGEADLIREAARRVLDGESIHGICVDWNKRGIQTVSGSWWRTTSLRRTLGSYYIAGLRHHMGTTYRATWEPIISPGEHAALLRIFASRAKGVGPQPRSRYLTGLLRCGRCGSRMQGKPTSRGQAGYICTGEAASPCGGTRRKAIPLEEMIRAVIFERIETEEFVERMLRASAPTVDTDAIITAIRADELALDELAHDRYVSRVIGPSEHLVASTALTARLEANRAALASIAPQAHGMDLMDLRTNVRARWESEGVEWRHRLASWLIDHITVGPSPRGRVPFHEKSIEVTWRL